MSLEAKMKNNKEKAANKISTLENEIKELKVQLEKAGESDDDRLKI